VSNHIADFGPYRLDEMLGRGGMGEVYRAYDTEHRRTVAIKRLSPHLADDPEFQRRFRREAHNVAQLSNPHIVPIHRYGEIDGRLYIDMRFVEGGDLDRLVATSTSLPFGRGVRILEQIASALDDAHRSGMVHRDVKPSNVLLDARVADFCYLADFGITKLASTERSTSLTNTGALMGSLAYMAPEQFDGAVTKQSDIYALTCIFYELVTGHQPYDGEGLPALMHAHMMFPPPLPSARNPGAALFDDVVATGMAKQADLRYSSAGDLARAARSALESHRSQATIAPDGPPSSVDEPASRTPNRSADPVSAGPPPEERASRAATDRFPPSALRAAAASWSGPAAGREEPKRFVPRAAAVRAEHAGPAPSAPQRPRLDRRRLLPLAAVAVIVAVVAGIWGVAQGMAATGTGSGDGTSATTSAPVAAPAPAPDAAPTSAPAATPAATPAGATLPEAMYVGHTADGKVAVALGYKDGKTAAYLCDGTSVEAWLDGTVTGPGLALENKTRTTTLEATLTGRTMSGTITKDDRQQGFSAELAVGSAGLYGSEPAVKGITTRIGWIILADGEAVGIRTENGVSAPAPPLDLTTLTATEGRESFRAEKLTGASPVVKR
jgi:serine/threonine protein kinase